MRAGDFRKPSPDLEAHYGPKPDIASRLKSARTGISAPDGLINEARQATPWPFEGRLCQNLR